MELVALSPVSFLQLVLVVCLRDVCVSAVEPPSNVVLHCRNMDNALKWEYGQNPPGLKFRVDIAAYYRADAEGFRNQTWVEPPALEADLSFLSDPSEAYFLTVTAVVGDQESNPSPSENGITFSYDKDADVDQKCFVDLPSVNMTAKPHDSVLLRFQHPWLMLTDRVLVGQKTKTRRKKSHDVALSDDLPVFLYKVTMVDQKQDHSYLCEEAVCEELLPVDPQQDKHCVQINGNLEHMLVKGSQVYCAEAFQETALNYTLIYVGGFLAAVLVLTSVIFMIYHKKTKPSGQSSSLNFDGRSTRQMPDPCPESFTEIEVCPSSPTFLLPQTEDRLDLIPPATNSADDTLRMRLGVAPQDDTETVEEDSAYRHGGSLEGDDDPSLFCYERRTMPVELEAGDLAKGYRG